MDNENTCDKCENYTCADPDDGPSYRNCGRCSLMGDFNRMTALPDNLAAGWDYESYAAGVFVGPKFGCIHFTRRT